MKKKNYFYNLLLTVFNLVIPVVSFPYAARILGPEGVGKIQFIMTLGQYLALIAALGIPIYGVRQIARVKHSPELLSGTIKELLTINCIMCIIFFAGYRVSICNYAFFSNDIRLYAWAGLIILLGFSSVEWIFLGLEAFKPLAIRSIAFKAASVVLILLCVRTKDDNGAYLFASMFAILANNGINLLVAAKLMRVKSGAMQLRRHLLPLLYILGTTVASTLYTTFDSIILGFLAGDRSVGLYAAATKVTKIAIPVIMAYGSVLLPEITRSYQNSSKANLEQYLNRSYAYITMLSVPISAGLFVLSPALMTVFSGKEFAEAVPAMRTMAFLPILIGLGYFWGYQVILPFGRDRLLLIAAIAGMLTSLLLNFMLVPQLKQDGAAIAIVSAEIIVTLCYFLLIRKTVTVSIHYAYLAKAVVCSLPFFLFLPFRSDYIMHSELLSLLINGVACVLIYSIMQIFVFKNDIILGIIKKYRGA